MTRAPECEGCTMPCNDLRLTPDGECQLWHCCLCRNSDDPCWRCQVREAATGRVVEVRDE